MEQQRIASGFVRGFHQFHVRFVGGSSSFADVAIEATANDVFPCRGATSTFRHDVVEAKAVHPKPLSAILATILVSKEDVSTIELHAVARKAIVSKQANDSRNLNFKIDGANPIGILAVFQCQPQKANFQPVFKVIRMKCPIIDRNDFRSPLVE